MLARQLQQDSTAIIQLYTVLSKSFMTSMEKVAEAAYQERYKDGPMVETGGERI